MKKKTDNVGGVRLASLQQRRVLASRKIAKVYKARKIMIAKRFRKKNKLIRLLKRLDALEQTILTEIKKNRDFIKPLAFVSAGLIIFSITAPTLVNWAQNSGYEINAKAAEYILDEPSAYYGVYLQLSEDGGSYMYNEFYDPGSSNTLGAKPEFQAEFPLNPKEGFSVTDPVNNVSVTLKPKFPLKSPIQEENRLVYPLIGVDGAKVLTLSGAQVKEDIILDSYQGDELDFSYELELPDGVDARLEADGSLSFYGTNLVLLGDVATGSPEDEELLAEARKNSVKTNLLFRIPAPVVLEENKRPSVATVRYALEGNVLTLKAAGLGEANYPLSLDPSIYIETARKLMRGNNETNIDFDIDNELIKKGFTTGARFDTWNSTMNLNDGRWNQGTAVAGGFIYAVGGEKSAGTTTSYSTTGANTYVVPAGVTEITVKMWGAGGGGGGGGTNSSGLGGAGGGSGYVSSTLTVTPAESLSVYVGAGGGAGDFSSGPNGNYSGDGGGGGGRSYIERTGTPLLRAAGGAGGGGGDSSSSTDGGGGGAGGGTSGQAGSASSSAPGGGAGTATAGGAGGNGSENDGVAGGSEYGGAGADGATDNTGTDGSKANGGNPNGGSGGVGDNDDAGFAGGGGGGDGYYGGGGGSSSIAGNAGGGGGGGGSSYTTGASTTNTGGSGSVPGNDTDGDRAGAGSGGTGGLSSSSGSAGSAGKVTISYAGAGSGPRKDVYWAQLSTANNSIESPNPGAGVCTDWCTDSSYDLPDERVGFSIVAYNGFIYVIGGEDATGIRQNTVYIAKLGVNGEPSLWHPTDTDKNNWVYWYSSANTLTNATSYSSAAAYNNRLYLIGGQTDASTGGVNVVYVSDFNPTGDIKAWSTTGMTTLPSVRHGQSVQVYNDYMYLIGGNSNGTLQDTVYYNKIDRDGTLNVWTSTSAFSTARSTWGGTNSVIWGGYLYLAGGCSVVNASGYCTTIQSDIQLASINADGSLDEFDTVANVTNQRIGYGFVAWDNALYRIGGCGAQNATTGECDTPLNNEDYAIINQDGDASTVSISQASGSGNCTGASPYDCDLPPGGDDAGEAGQMLSSVAVINGFLYVIGGCVDYTCSGTNPQPTDVSGNVAYTVINNDGTLGKPSTCTDTYYEAWCVDSTNRVNGTTGTAASGITVFGGRMYLIGGLTGAGNHGNIYYNSFNTDGSLSGAWTSQTLTNIGITTDISYTYAYARANPSSAGTYPGNLFVIGGCGGTSGAGCTGADYRTEAYKCNITTTGSLEEADANDCTTTGQLQLDTETTAGSQGLGIHSGTVYANYIYLVGGYSQNVADRDTIFYAKFDDSNNIVAVSGTAWILNSTTLNTGRRRGSAFGYNGYLYAVGGFDSNGGSIIDDIEYAKVDVSDGSVGAFSTSAVTINQRWGLAMAVTNSYAYVIGGCDVGDSPGGCTSFEPSVQTFQLYNNDSGTAASFGVSANLFSTDRYGSSSAIYNGYIYVAGGCTVTADPCTTATNSVQYAPIDAEGDVGAWSATTANLPANRAWGQLEVAGGTLYYIGGQDDTATNEQSTVYYGTPSTGDVATWSTATNGLPAARTQFSSAVWNNRIYVVSGLDSTASETNTVYYSPQLSSGGDITSAWTSDTDVPDIARSGNTVVAYANNLYSFGGYDGTNYLLDSQFTQINSDGSIDPWIFTTSLPSYIRQGDGFAANGYMYVVGGRSATATCDSNTLVTPISANTTIATGNNPTGIGEWYETNEKYTGDRYGASVAYNQGKMYLTGGQCNSTFTGANRALQTAMLSQPQVARYSRLIDTDTDVFPNKFLLNGLDNSIGARWEVKYSSSTDASSTWGQETDFGEVTLGTVNSYTPLDGTGTDTNSARFMYFWIEIDSTYTFGYPEDVNRGPTIDDITLFFTSDPGKRLRHGKTFTGGEKQPLDTPPP